MILNLKSFRRSIYFLMVVLPGCKPSEVKYEQPVVDNKLLLVVDQSKSVDFVSKSTIVEDVLLNTFQTTYKNVTCPTAFYRATITGESNVVALSTPFRQVVPDEESMGAVSYRQKYAEWRSAKRKWITDGIEDLKKTIYATKSGSTDVYGIFKCVELTANKMKPADTLHLVFFSDMKHSMKGYELMDSLRSKTPALFARNEFKRLAIKQITDKLYCLVTIVTPGNFKKSDVVVAYWESFFKEWGLTSNIDWR